MPQPSIMITHFTICKKSTSVMYTVHTLTAYQIISIGLEDELNMMSRLRLVQVLHNVFFVLVTFYLLRLDDYQHICSCRHIERWHDLISRLQLAIRKLNRNISYLTLTISNYNQITTKKNHPVTTIKFQFVKSVR